MTPTPNLYGPDKPTDLQTAARAHLMHIVNQMRTRNDTVTDLHARTRVANLLLHTRVEHRTGGGLTLHIGRVAPPYTADGYPIARNITDRFTLTDAGADRRTARTLRVDLAADGYTADITWEEPDV